MLRDGIDRSPTLRRLVERVERGDVVVYLQPEQATPGLMVAALTWIGASDSMRFVRASIKVRPRNTSVVASVSHELQHVVEVLEAPWVTSDRDLRTLYKKIGERTTMHEDIWDTAVARWTTQQVLRELSGVATATVVDDER